MARSRHSLSILIRYGSLKVSSIDAFLGCWNSTGMIVSEELLSQERKCFEQLTWRTRQGNHISLPKLERPSSESRQQEENHTLALHLSLVVRISHSMEMVEAETLSLSVA